MTTGLRLILDSSYRLAEYLTSSELYLTLIMAPNPPNRLFACTEYIPSCKVNHSRQEEKLLISHFLMCPHHVQTMTLSLKFLFYESFFNHSPNTIHVISFLNRHFLSTALCKLIS